MHSPRRRFRLVWYAVAGALLGGSSSFATAVLIGLGFFQSRSELLRWIALGAFFGELLLGAISILYLVAWALFLRRPGAGDVKLSKFTLREAFGFVTLVSIVVACITNFLRGVTTEAGWSVVISWIVGWEALGAALGAPFHRKTLGVFLISIVLPFILLAEFVAAVWLVRLLK